LILAFKYGHRTDLLPFFAKSVIWTIMHENMLDIDLIVPVPTTFTKFKKRGYNPPGLLAHEISKMTGVPEEHQLLQSLTFP